MNMDNPISKHQKNYYSINNSSIKIYITILFLCIFMYFMLLTLLPLPNEKPRMKKCPKQAVCNKRFIENETIISIHHCNNIFQKLEKGLIQICSPNSQPMLNIYLDTVNAAAFISRNDGNCFFKHKKIDSKLEF